MSHPFKALTLACLAFHAVAGASTKPNFLIILADDLGYGDVSTYHASDVNTPNIDRLASEGMLFTAMRANCTVCSPWRGGKQDHYDGGLRVPFMVRWPGRIKTGTRSDYQGLNFDIFPTFLEIAGVTPSPELDAVSLLPILDGAAVTKPRDLYFVRREGGIDYGGKSYEAIIRDGWKLMQNDPYRPLELYNLKCDPQEKQNLLKTESSKVAELAPQLRAHIRTGGATPWRKTSSDSSSTR